ncbi:sulfurtransferase [Amphritea sp. 2_MG-2023]|uniref:sulfurtransferase n=1 Tax=Amphritea TaxID=515417 RepID=UPI001C07EEB6|nr:MULTISPECIES: sulfurtransferase [Amphritea]MBU2964634.1 sulfurtransferase [Amphritea atlantica]MDO6420424.1 sulfurtransferase [Amphritea sp. 2_MG-2023]
MTTVLLDPQELQQKIDNEKVVLIDTRNPEQFAAGHIPGAVNIHDIFTFLAASTPEGIAELKGKFAGVFGKAGLSGEETAVVYEDSMNSGFGQSCRGYFLLCYLGYPKVSILHGGFQAWKAAGLAETAEVLTPVAAEFPLDHSADGLMVDKDDVLKALGNDEIVLLDVRDVDEWVGTSSSPYGRDYSSRKGRLPGARWLEWYRLMKPGAVPVFKSSEEVLADCASVGINKNSHVYIYCFKGARASNTLVALKAAGIENVKLYFGSWNEWAEDASLPIETGLPYAC